MYSRVRSRRGSRRRPSGMLPPGGATVQQLFDRISDWGTIREAYEHVMHDGGRAAGPDGVGPRDLDPDEVWQLCTVLSASVRNGTYRLGEVRFERIPKVGKNGFREIAVPNLADRVVGSAIYMVLGPVLEPDFVANSFGFRKGLDREHAIVRAEAICRQTGNVAVLVNDVRDAFPSGPRPRLMDIVRLGLPDDRLCRLIESSIRSRRRGLLQGLPLSPLLLNVYLDHFLDQPWRRLGTNAELLRYADDLMLVFGDLGEAEALHGRLGQILFPTGMRLKYSFAESLGNLRHDKGVDWLGWNLRWDGDEMIVSITKKSWESLRDGLRIAQESVDAPFHAIQVINGWVAQQGPCFHPDRFDLDTFFDQIQRTAVEEGFEEIPTVQQIEQTVRESWSRFDRLRASTLIGTTATAASANGDREQIGVSAVSASA